MLTGGKKNIVLKMLIDLDICNFISIFDVGHPRAEDGPAPEAVKILNVKNVNSFANFKK